MLRTALLAASRSAAVRGLAEAAVLRPLVDRYVAGAGVEQVIAVARDLAVDRLVTLDHLGEVISDRAHADATAAAYEQVLGRLADEGLAGRVEVSVRLSALGQGLDRDADAIALANARRICAAAAAAGTTVTVAMEDHTTTDRTLGAVRALRADHPWVGAVLQAQLQRTEADCRDLTGPGSRVRLCTGAYDGPASVAFRRRADVDLSFVRCLKVLMAGEGLPMVATHDPRLIAIARELGRERPYELQMLHGVQAEAQEALAADGEAVRVYLPYGPEWSGYVTRLLAERPADLALVARSLLTRG